MKQINRLIGVATVVVSLSALTGCVETAGTVVTTDHTSGSTLVLEDSTRLKGQVQVLKINYDEVNGLKRVHITLASTRHRRLRLHYRIAWFDANGMELDPATKTYRTLILEGRDSVTVTGLANSAAAVTSKLQVRDLDAAD